MSMQIFRISLFALSAILLVVSITKAATVSKWLQPHLPIEVSIAPKRFDLMTVDSAYHRLLAAHSRAGTLTVVDLATHRLEKEIPVGRSSGVAVDAQDGKYFVGTTRGIAVVDRRTLKKTGFITTPGPADAMIYDSRDGRLYVGHDDASELWVIDPHDDKITGRITIPGAPELMAVDPKSHRLYVNIKPRNEVVAINTVTDEIVAHWSTLPTESPHGLALDLSDQRLFVVGHSRMVSVFSLPTGEQLQGVDIGPGHVDQIAFDAPTRTLYCPTGGRLVTVKVGADSETVVDSVTIPQGTHSVAVDPATHWAWIAYANKDHSYVQGFAPRTSGK